MLVFLCMHVEKPSEHLKASVKVKNIKPLDASVPLGKGDVSSVPLAGVNQLLICGGSKLFVSVPVFSLSLPVENRARRSVYLPDYLRC